MTTLTSQQSTTLSSIERFLYDAICLYGYSFQRLPDLVSNDGIELSKKIKNALCLFNQIEFNNGSFDNNELYAALRDHCYSHKNTLNELHERINILFTTKD